MSLKQNQFSHALRLILVLALLAGMFAWAAQPAQAAADAAPLAAVKWGAKLVNHTVVIMGSGFPASHTFYVRAKYRLGDPYSRIGKARSNRLGKINATVNLPPIWYEVPNLRVCLKDTVTSKAYCVVAKR